MANAKDISEADAEAKRRCIQSLSTELLTLLQQLATDEAKGEFASLLRCNGSRCWLLKDTPHPLLPLTDSKEQ